MIRNEIKKDMGAFTRILVVGALGALGANAYAQGQLVYGYSADVTGSSIFSFDSSSPGNILSQHSISGLQANETLAGIDWHNGIIYGLGNQSHVYALDPNSGVATWLNAAQFTPGLNGLSFGVDNGPAGLVAVSNLRQSLTLDRTTGNVVSVNPTVAYAVGDPHFGTLAAITALAYDNSSGIWYAADSGLNTFATYDPATGNLTTLGTSGIDFSRINGFDISPNGVAYLASPAASSDPQANLYTVDKVTGQVTVVGLIGQPNDNILVGGLTVVPEPASMALFGLGGSLLLVFLRRRA